MITIQELKELMKLIDRSSIQHFELEAESAKITISKAASEKLQPVTQTVYTAAAANTDPSPAVASAAASATPASETSPAFKADPKLRFITAPLVGTFYTASDPNAKPYVQVGDRVQPGSIVCMVEAMKMFNQIEAEVGGEIVEVLVKNGQLVEYGQPLFTVRTE